MTTNSLNTSALLESTSLHSSMIRDVEMQNNDDDTLMFIKCIDGTLYLPRVEAKKVLAKHYKAFDKCSDPSDAVSLHVPIQVVLDAYGSYKDGMGTLTDVAHKSVQYLQNGFYNAESNRPVYPSDCETINWGSYKAWNNVNFDGRHWQDVNCLLKFWMPELPTIITEQLGDFWDNAIDISVYYHDGSECTLKLSQIIDYYNLFDPTFAKQIGRTNSYLFLPLRVQLLFGDARSINFMAVKASHNPYPSSAIESKTLLEDFDGLRVQLTSRPNDHSFYNDNIAKIACPSQRVIPSYFNVRVKPNNRSELRLSLNNEFRGNNAWNQSAIVVKVKNSDLPLDEIFIIRRESLTESCLLEDLKHTRWLWTQHFNPGYNSHQDFSYLLLPGDTTSIGWNTRNIATVVMNVYYVMNFAQ